MDSQYRVQLSLPSLVTVMALVGFGVGVMIGIASFIWSLFGGGQIFQAVVAAVISPFSNGAIMALFGLVGYPFYNWYCSRNRGQVLRGKFLEEKPAESD